jgi:hypothetical protein
MKMTMTKPVVSLVIAGGALLLLGGCGVEVGAAAAAQGATAAEQDEEGTKTQERVEQRLEDAQAVAAKARQQAETDSE